MPRDALAAVVRIRRIALDEARRELAVCVAAEDDAAASVRGAEEAIRAEQRAASALDADDRAVEAFGVWLPRGRQAIAQAESARARAQATTAQARARLSASRAAAEAADQMMTARLALEAETTARQQQAAIDEIASNRPVRNPGG